MRKRIVAGNWKMNLIAPQAVKLTHAIIEKSKDSAADIILAVPAVYLAALHELLKGNKGIFVSAQNCSGFTSGAYTGEISAAMLASIGIRYSLVGHSERRNYFHETNEMLAAKVERLLENNIHPVFCCGETLPQRNNGDHFKSVEAQLSKGLFHLKTNQVTHCILAYEPVWAIGTGVNATAEQAQEMHSFIRNLVAKKYSSSQASEISILYGGSVTPQNAGELFACGDVDGGLVGGASLKAEDFLKIIQSMNVQIAG